MPITVNHSGSLNTLRRNLQANPKKSMQLGILHNSKVAPYATYLEYGWVQKITKAQAGWFGYNYGIHLKVGNTLSMPPRPFLRGTLLAEKDKWIKLVGSALPRYEFNLEQALAFMGGIALQDVQATIQNGGTAKGAFDRRSWLTRHMGETNALNQNKRFNGTPNQTQTDKPLYRAGDLHNAIGFEIK